MINTVLITGVHGLLGSQLASVLVDQGFVVHGVTRRSHLDRKSPVKYLSIDFSSHWSVQSLPTDCDAIIHLAQSVKFRDFPGSALDVFNVNIASTAYLLDYAHQVGVKKFVYASSGGVYGNANKAFRENSPIVPPGKLGYYLGSKACGEVLVKSYSSVFDVVVIRPFFIYGLGQKRSMLIPRLFDRIAAGEHIVLQGENGIRINPIHVSDASAAVAAALLHDGSATFNIGGPDVISIREISDRFASYLGVNPIYIKQAGMPSDLIADISLMRNELFNPQISLFDSIRHIAFQ